MVLYKALHRARGQCTWDPFLYVITTRIFLHDDYADVKGVDTRTKHGPLLHAHKSTLSEFFST